MDMPRDIRLFAYGTLQNPDVQQAAFGRLLDGSPDAVVGFRLEPLEITDPHVIYLSCSDEHPGLVPTVAPNVHVEATLFLLSSAELEAADEYEIDNYHRIEVPMASGVPHGPMSSGASQIPRAVDDRRARRAKRRRLSELARVVQRAAIVRRG